jgi:hypothetical protein
MISAGLLALPIFNSSSHPACGGTVIFAIEDISLLVAGSESQLRGSFRFRPGETGHTEFPFNDAYDVIPESLFEKNKNRYELTELLYNSQVRAGPISMGPWLHIFFA